MQTIGRPIHIAWITFGIVALVLAFYLDFLNLRSVLLGRQTPNVEIAFFAKERGELVLHRSGESVIRPSEEDIKRKRVAFPLNLAVHNLERDALRGARIEVSYPKGLRLKPEGSPKIDPENRVLIYEHELQPLEPVGSFTPLDTVDTIYLSADFLEFFDVNVEPGQLQLESPYFVEAFSPVLRPTNEQEIELGVKFFAEGRPPKVGTIKLSFKSMLNVVENISEIDYRTVVDPGDIREILQPYRSRSARILSKWVRLNSHGQMISYQKVSIGGGTYQLIDVNGGPSRIIADTNSDGFIEYSRSGTPGISTISSRVAMERLKMEDWRPLVTEITTPDGREYRFSG